MNRHTRWRRTALTTPACEISEVLHAVTTTCPLVGADMHRPGFAFNAGVTATPKVSTAQARESLRYSETRTDSS